MTLKSYAREVVHPELTASFKLNEGAALGSAQDISAYITNEPKLSEKLTQSSLDLGGVILPDVSVILENQWGEWYKDGKFFKGGFISDSQITLTTNYIDTLNNDTVENPGHVFRGLIKWSTCDWRFGEEKLNVQLLDVSNLLQSNSNEVGVITQGMSFSQAIYAMVNRSYFTKYVTVSAGNINPGYDMAGVIDGDVDDFSNKTVKENLDKLSFLSTSVYYIDQSGNFIVEPIAPTSPSVIYNFDQSEISLVNLVYDWQGFINSYTWDDSNTNILIVEMGNNDRDALKDPFKSRKIDYKFITSQTNRALLMTNLLEITQYKKRKIKFRCKFIPELRVNGYITINIDQGLIQDDLKPFIWNDSTWNGGYKWNHRAPGITVNPSVLWRIIEIERDLTGDVMTVTAKVTGRNADEEI